MITENTTPETLEAAPEAPEAQPAAITTETPDEPKKGRGRPRKDGKPRGAPYTRNRKKKTAQVEKLEPEPAPETTTATATDETDLFGDLSNFAAQPGNEPTPAAEPPPVNPMPETAPAAEYISGYILLVICDFVFPMGISLILRKFAKKDISAEQLQLTGRELNKLEPLADAAAKQLSVQLSPLAAFGMTMAAIYGGKAITATAGK